jgi:hypothetical protein
MTLFRRCPSLLMRCVEKQPACHAEVSRSAWIALQVLERAEKTPGRDADFHGRLEDRDNNVRDALSKNPSSTSPSRPAQTGRMAQRVQAISQLLAVAQIF